MFHIYSLSKTFLRTSKTYGLCICKREFIQKPLPEKFGKKLFKKYCGPPTLEQIKQMKLVPDDFEVVYINNQYKLFNIALGSMYLCWGVLGISLVQDFIINKEFSFENLDVKVALLFYTAAGHIGLTKTVSFIFRKNGQFRTVILGSLGSLKRVIIDHNSHECSPPKALSDEKNFEELAKYFENLLNCPEPILVIPKSNCTAPQETDESTPPTEEEITKHILKLKNNKASGEDGILAEFLK